MGAGTWKWAMRAVFGACLFQALYYRDLLPESVATHFDLSGQADGYSSRTGWFWFHVVLAGSFWIMFEVLGPFVRRLPDRWINLPNRDYWLAPHRREQSLGFVDAELTRTGALTLLFVFGVGQLVIDANLEAEGKLNNGWFLTLIGVYIVAMIHLCIRLFRRFPRGIEDRS